MVGSPWQSMHFVRNTACTSLNVTGVAGGVSAGAAFLAAGAFAVADFLAAVAFFGLQGMPAGERVLHHTVYTWLSSGRFQLAWLCARSAANSSP